VLVKLFEGDVPDALDILEAGFCNLLVVKSLPLALAVGLEEAVGVNNLGDLFFVSPALYFSSL
jgi:hypothetical protein